MENIIENPPNIAENYFHLGLACNKNRQFDLAITHYHAALSYNPYYGFAWNNLGAALESIGDKVTAKIAYTTAIAINPLHAEAQNNLAVIYSEAGEIEQARYHFEQAISANPQFIDAHYNLSLIKTYTSDDLHLHFLESLLPTITQHSIQSQIYYYFALGKALDDTKNYARAYTAYEKGNMLHHAQKPWDKLPLQNFVEKIPSIFTPSFLEKQNVLDDKRCPIFIVGMPRSGTTLIEQILASHRDIYGAGELKILDDIIKAAHQRTQQSFDTWVRTLSDADFLALGKQYLDRVWQLAPEKKYIIDKMPSNFFYIGMIYRLFPNAKIIHAIRDPMDICFSCFTHLFQDNMSFSYDFDSLSTYYHWYASAMRHWHTVLPKNTIIDVVYEEMIADYETKSKQLIEYLGLTWDPSCLQFHANKRKVKTASLTQVRQPIYKTSMQRWRHFETELSPLKNALMNNRNKT